MQWHQLDHMQTICTSLQTPTRHHSIFSRPDALLDAHHTRPFNHPLSGITQVSRYQKGKTNLGLLKQETVSGSGISWAICKSAPRSRQITMPAPHHSVFYRPDALPDTHCQQYWSQYSVKYLLKVISANNFSCQHLHMIFFQHNHKVLCRSKLQKLWY